MTAQRNLTDHEWDMVFDEVYNSYVERIINCLRRHGTLSLREERMSVELIYQSPTDYEWDEAFSQKNYSRRILADIVTYVSDGAFRLDYIPAPKDSLSDKKEIVVKSCGERSIIFRLGGRRNLPYISDRHFYYLMRLVERMAEIADGADADGMLSFYGNMVCYFS